MKKTIFCVIALGMSVATVYGQDEVTAINTGAANFLTIMPDARTAALEIGRRRVGKECRSRWSPYH